MFRNSHKAFLGDREALRLVHEGLEKKDDQNLLPVERFFFYMPLMHSENLKIQDESITCFQNLLDEVPLELKGKFENTLKYAYDHRYIIQKFSRFPHRNSLLSRESTQEELEFLKQPNSSF